MSPQQPITCELSSNRWLQWLISVSTIEMNQWSCSSILGSRAWANFRLQPALPCFDTCRACLPTSASYPTKASTVKRFIFLVSCFLFLCNIIPQLVQWELIIKHYIIISRLPRKLMTPYRMTPNAHSSVHSLSLTTFGHPTALS